MPDLPQELVDAIVDEVPVSSLAACSLTAPAFVVSSQRRLFRWMSLHQIPSYERAAHLLAASPHLGPYFRYLALDITGIPKDYAALKAILNVLSGLEYLTVLGDSPTAATSNQMAQNSCLIQLLSLPTLRCLGFQDLRDIPSSLISRALSSCEEVSLVRVSIADEWDDLALVDEMPAPGDLWHLGVRADLFETIMPFILHPKRIELLRQLERFSVAFPPIPESLQPSFKKFLVACSDTLEHLKIELEEPPTYLPTLPSLGLLELFLDVEYTKTPAVLHSIISGTLPSTPHLEVLVIAILDRPDGPHRPSRQQWTGNRLAEWADLDSTLMDVPSLCEVEFSLRAFNNTDQERYTAFIAYIEAHLPRSFDAGLLGFTYFPTYQHPMDTFVG
ncbi:hypothetical protein B0H14DRAFT_3601050 [Mycena olivaceomarginata]|nr:hypothetical protein B0H14DRAFT_3601050 [Mycena olivaceomarginata]